MHPRRQFLLGGISGVSAVWVANHWPAAVAAVTHARHLAQSGAPPRFEFFTPEMAKEIDCMVTRIIPTDETPGAREAGVVYFIDRALTTFARGDRRLYTQGIAEVQAKVHQMFPGVDRFSAATEEQQDEILRALDEERTALGPFRSRPPGQSFFETIRQHAIAGFLIDPESDRRGNRDGVGWQLIGRELAHTFQPPFGQYDKGYAGWEVTVLGTKEK